MSQISIIGVGPGGEHMLTLAAREAIDQSDTVFAAKRHAHLVHETCKVLPLEPLREALDTLAEQVDNGKRISVLLSGDPGIYSMLPLLEARFGADRLTVYPGISALQALCAEAKETWQDAKIISGHGRPLTASALGHAARTHAKTIVFCDAAHDARWIAESLVLEGLSELEMIVGERLSYADQRITRGKASELARIKADPLCVVMLTNPSPAKGLPPTGLPDDRFIRGKTPMTKREIRVQIMAELEFEPDAIVWDIGAGTGSVSIECARQCPLGKVNAIERDGEALELIQRNSDAFHLNNIHIVSGSAPECLAGLPAPTHVFIGGSGGGMGGIFDVIEAMPSSVRVVGTAVTMEGEQGLLKRMRGYRNFRMVQIAVSRVESIGTYHMLKAQNPVYIASGTWEGKQ